MTVDPEGEESGTVELTESDVADLLSAGSAAPSSHDRRPWRLSWVAGAVEVHRDPARLLPMPGPDARELNLACGAAVANVHLALRAQGRRAHTTLLPDATDSWFCARVRPGSDWPAWPWERELATGIHHRTAGRPLLPAPVSPRHRDDLVRAAERAGCWLVFGRLPGDDRDERPTVAVVATFQDAPRAQLRAGWAMQDVLLTAAARAVAASVVASPLETHDLREEVRAQLGGGLWPQVVLRLGHGDPMPALPRRPRTPEGERTITGFGRT